MAKLLLLLCIALFAMTCVMACTPPGMLCTDNSQCCAPFVCNPWAGRCTKASPIVPNPPNPPVDGGAAGGNQ